MAQNVVLVELFTSQGCSSCPAADENLAEIVEQATQRGHQVYGLSFHVDYWNYIGWKDPYSKAEFTARQRKYSSIMMSEGVYTPQMIINGRAEFVGSNKRISSQEIEKALQQKMSYQITLGEVNQQNGKISVAYSLDKAPTNEVINLALVQSNISNDVTAGENSGKNLTHRNVVRSLTSLPAQKMGMIEVDVPSNITFNTVILFVQDSQWHISGAVGKAR